MTEPKPQRVQPARFETGRPMLLAGVRRTHAYESAATSMAAQWRDFFALPPIPGRVGSSIHGAIAGADAQGFEYLAAVEVASFDPLDPGLGRMRVPSQRYAVFVHEGPIEGIRETWRAILEEWLPSSGRIAAHGPDLEHYGPDFDLEARRGRMEIAFPVEPLADEGELPTALRAIDVAPRSKPSTYPEPFASRMIGREKRALGDRFGLRNFGVNQTRLAPGACSSLRHAHRTQDEFVYVLAGHPTLRTNAGATRLSPGDCAGFAAGTGDAHHLVNETAEDVVYLEVGDRSPGDVGSYPDDDLVAVIVDGAWRFTRKDGSPH